MFPTLCMFFSSMTILLLMTTFWGTIVFFIKYLLTFLCYLFLLPNAQKTCKHPIITREHEIEKFNKAENELLNVKLQRTCKYYRQQDNSILLKLKCQCLWFSHLKVYWCNSFPKYTHEMSWHYNSRQWLSFAWICVLYCYKTILLRNKKMNGMNINYKYNF